MNRVKYIPRIIKRVKKQIDQEEKDAFDTYAAYVAAELRSVEDDRAVTQAKYHINNILYKLKMGQYNTSYGYVTGSRSSSSQSNGQDSDTLDVLDDK